MELCRCITEGIWLDEQSDTRVKGHPWTKQIPRSVHRCNFHYIQHIIVTLVKILMGQSDFVLICV